jgi:hypothetical protein
MKIKIAQKEYQQWFTLLQLMKELQLGYVVDCTQTTVDTFYVLNSKVFFLAIIKYGLQYENS